MTHENRTITEFYTLGFHGDSYLLACADSVLKKAEVFIETGANIGSTLAYVARTYPHVHCYSCEADPVACNEAARSIAREELGNVMLFCESSQNFMQRLRRDHTELFSQETIFWLDAHGNGFEWPLKKEIEFITNHFKTGHAFIDDFKVPGMEWFGYDQYNGQVCSFEYIHDALDSSRSYSLYYPNYRDKTSPHHPLRGWGLLSFGAKRELFIPKRIKEKVRSEIHEPAQ
ncbi:MAG: hypothetical protein GF401_09975 [Chitinivibrionales bacterium]|nr:hypothetical protein [Chitinivibrionales bacterium]